MDNIVEVLHYDFVTGKLLVRNCSDTDLECKEISRYRTRVVAMDKRRVVCSSASLFQFVSEIA